MPRENENDPRPLQPPGGSFAPTSGVLMPMIGCKLVVNVTTAAASLSFRTLDGNTIVIATSSLPVGVYTFDVQFDTVTWTTATVAAFYRL